MSIAVIPVLFSCQVKPQESVVGNMEYNEPHRPQVHFSPKEKWTNDPNGMFYLDGEYHLFYQHYPDSNVWGPMHWGHAVSRDLVHWEHLPIALYPDTLGYIFSGSAVVDVTNTSGFGTKENPPVVAIYTYHDSEGERSGRNDFQTQGIAYSLDKGRTWTKYQHNPVLPNPGIRDFRDPKVSWNDKSGQWVMTLAVKDHIEFYGSHDLKKWNKLSEFGKEEGDHGGVWECPDLFPLTDEKGNEKYVLLVSINPGAPNGGSGTQYFIGNFNGTTFTNDTPGKNSGWIDYGTDNYAGVTFGNLPDRRILIGWMNNWEYAQVVPTTKWRGAMTMPRVLTLQTINDALVLTSAPVTEVKQLVRTTTPLDPTSTDALVLAPQGIFSVPSIVRGKISRSDFVLKVSNRKDEGLLIGFDTKQNHYFIDRSHPGKSDFHEKFKTKMIAPRVATDDWIAFTVIIDVSSVEVFFDDGATVMTAIVFPDENFDRIKLYGGDKPIKTDTLYVEPLNRVW